MLLRIFSVVLTSIFFLATYGESHSMETTSQSYIPEFFSVRQAVKYWDHHCQNSTIDRGEVREKISKLTCDYDYLKKKGFDVLNLNDDIGNVFTNISLNCYQREEDELVWLLGALVESPVTSLTLQDFTMTPNIGEAVVRLLNGDKRFQKIDLNGRRNPKLVTHDLRWEGFDSSTDEKYQMIKRIGLAAAEKVDEFVFSKYSSTKQCPFDFVAYSPEQEFREVYSADQKLKKHNGLWCTRMMIGCAFASVPVCAFLYHNSELFLILCALLFPLIGIGGP